LPKWLLASLVLLTIFLTTPCHAVSVTLAWDPSPDAETYTVYWGTSQGTYLNSVETDETSAVIPALDFDTLYYFVVKAKGVIDGKTIESSPSREVYFIHRSDPVKEMEK
jgi:hypothetical protein